MKNIHINCDLGEGGDHDEHLMPLISACNIACGGHAGTLETMHHTVQLAMENNVEIGAHPSYPDKENFGRKTMDLPNGDLKRSLIAQILSLKQITEAEGAKLMHVKAHGALYNDAAKDEKVAELLIEAILEFEEKLLLFAPPKSVLAKLAEGRLEVVHEAFLDRNYNEDYSLVPRSEPNALVTEKELVYDRLSSMVFDREIGCGNGRKIACDASTFCIHGDTPNSVEIMRFLQEKLQEKGARILNT